MTRIFILLCLMCYIRGPSYVVSESRVLINRHAQQSTFKATDKWKRVQEGEAIPPGLHVRFNLTSNTVEAKLMDSDLEDDTNTNLLAIPQDNVQQEGEGVQRKRKYRSYQEIKESLKELNLAVKSELAIMIELVSKAKNILNSKDYNEQQLLDVLADLNDRVDHIDVGREFAKIGAIHDVIIPSLNKSADVQSNALILLGSALQNNQPVQIAAFESGLLNKLLALIGSEKEPVVGRAMFALSALVRRFPFAQKAMMDIGGAGLLHDLFNVCSPQIQKKVLALVYDLIEEQADAYREFVYEDGIPINHQRGLLPEELEQAEERYKQYRSIDLHKRLVEHGWCSAVVNYLINIRDERRQIVEGDECPNISQPEHDKVEKILNLMLALADCNPEYKNSSALPCVILRFSKQYEALKRCENETGLLEPDETVANYYRNIGERFNTLARIVGDGQPLQCKDEL